MCSHYQAFKDQQRQERFLRSFGIEPAPLPGKLDVWPGYLGSFIRRHPHADVGDGSSLRGELVWLVWTGTPKTDDGLFSK